MTEEHQTSPVPGEAKTEAKDKEERLFAILGYASIGCFIPLTLKPKNEFCQFHGKQGLVLFVVSIIILFILALTPGLGLLLFLGYFALVVIAMFRTYTGEKWAIPIIAPLAHKINLGQLSMSTPTEASAASPQEEIKSEVKTESREETKEEKKAQPHPHHKK